MTDLTDAVVDDESSLIYTHPTLRTQTHEELLTRLQQIRDRRLVAALQYEQVRVSKAVKLGHKLHDQWEKLRLANKAKLIKIDDLIDQLDRSIGKQIEVSHQLAIVELDI